MSSRATIKDSYVFVSKRENPLSLCEIKNNYYKLQKDKLFCWVVSNCDFVSNDRIKRATDIINLLSEKTHIWGRARRQCLRHLKPGKFIDHGSQSREETDLIIEKCKFYFSFENSNCSDYVTEKFPNALINYAIPIVNGWRETYEENLPGSFIHVSDFKSTSDLASYLGYLLRNETAYFEYFR